MIYILNGVQLEGQFCDNKGINHPANWLELTTYEEKKALGIISLEEIWEELTDNQTHDGSFKDTDTQRIYLAIDIPKQDPLVN